MRIVYRRFESNETIPVNSFLSNRKLKKYFNRETAGAVVAIGELLADDKIDRKTASLHYATGIFEYEDYGLDQIAANSMDENRRFSMQRFVENGISNVSPLNQFKVLLNMPLCFISIEFGFRCDNAAVYSTTGALLTSALCAPAGVPLLVGAGKSFIDGSVESGFMLTDTDELMTIKADNLADEGYLFLRKIATQDHHL